MKFDNGTVIASPYSSPLARGEWYCYFVYEAFEERDEFLAGESAFMTSFTSAVTGAGRKLNNYDFDLRVRAS